MASSLVLLFISLLQISAGQQILPSKFVLLRDCTNNVDGVIAYPMDEMRKNIEKKLAQNPASHVVSGCIGETFSDNVQDKNLGNTINSGIIETKLIQEFRYSRFNRSSEIVILLIDSKTKLSGMVPAIVSMKKTIVIQFGPKEQNLWTNMASISDVAFHVQVSEDILKVEKQLAKELATMSQLVCDTTMYCLDRNQTLYTSCQCKTCDNICTFELDNVLGSCMHFCRYEPHFKVPLEPVTISATGNDTGKKTLSIAITVIIALLVVAAVVVVIIYCCKRRKKTKQHINEVEAQQIQIDNVADEATVETTALIDIPELNQNNGNDEIDVDVIGNQESAAVSNDESASEDSADVSNDESASEDSAVVSNEGNSAGGSGQSGVNDSEAIITMKDFGLNVDPMEFIDIRPRTLRGGM